MKSLRLPTLTMTSHPVAMVMLLTLACSPLCFGDKKEPFMLFGPTGIQANQSNPKSPITVSGGEKGSPAEGKFKKGDIIVGLNGQALPSKPTTNNGYLIKAILDAEAGDGKFTVDLKDKPSVTIEMQKLGPFASTAPYDCPKTDKMITHAAEHMLQVKRLSSHTRVECLGLLATGEKKYIDAVGESLRAEFGAMTFDDTSLQKLKREEFKKSGKGSPEVSAWTTAYTTITLAEYYYLTKDEAIFPALKTHALSLVEGQDPAGLFGHKMADPDTNRAPGYGQMNNVSLAAGLGLILSRKCGVDVPGLDGAIDKIVTYIKYHDGRGTFPYGFHGPRENEWNNNGTSGLAAICMSLVGDKPAATFFASCAAASYKSLGVGHASSLFSTYWTQVGANVLGPETTKAFFPKTHNYYTPRRNWDGSIAQCYNEGHFGGVVLLNHSLSRRALLITGRDADQSLWLNSHDAKAVVEMGEISEKDASTEQLFAYLNHPFPKVRANALESITSNISGKKFEKSLKSKPSEADQTEKSFGKLFPKIKQLAESGTAFEREKALKCFMLACPDEERATRMETLGIVLRNTEEADGIRVAAAAQLATQGALCKPYFDDILRFLLDERPEDHFAEIDAQIAEGLDVISKSLEFDYYKAGFVNDATLFHKAASRLMQHRRQNPRGTGARMVRFVPQPKFHHVARQLEHILKDDDPTYQTYHNARAAMEPAVQIFGDHKILEGVEYFTDYILTSTDRWSFRMMMLQKSLPAYGIHAKPMIPKLKDYKWVKVMYAQAENNEGDHRFLEGFEKMIAEIENAKTGPPLVPLDKAIQLSKDADQNTGK